MIRIMKATELKRIRDDLDLTQTQLAKKLSVDVMTVSRWERGKVKIPGVVMLALKQIQNQNGDN